MRSEDRKGLFSDSEREYIEKHTSYDVSNHESASKKHMILKRVRNQGEDNLRNTLTDWNLLMDYLISIEEDGTIYQLIGDVKMCSNDVSMFIRKWFPDETMIQLIREILIPPLAPYKEKWELRTIERVVQPTGVLDITTDYFDKIRFTDADLELKRNNLISALKDFSSSLGDRNALFQSHSDYQQFNPTVDPNVYDVEMVEIKAVELFEWLKHQKKTKTPLKSGIVINPTTGHRYSLDVSINMPFALLKSKYLGRALPEPIIHGDPMVVVARDSPAEQEEGREKVDFKLGQSILSAFVYGLSPGLNGWKDVLESYIRYFNNAYFYINEENNYGRGELIPFLFLREEINPANLEEIKKDHLTFPMFQEQLKKHRDCPTGLASSMKTVMSTLKNRGMIEGKECDWLLTPLGIEVSKCIGRDFIKFKLNRINDDDS